MRLALLALSLPLAAAAAAPVAFSHKIHVGDQEVPCKSCHDLKADGLPPLKTKGCTKCHEDGPPAYQGPTARKLKAQFPHKAHADKLECASCHKDVLADGHDGSQPLLARAECSRCHAEKKVTVAEGTCARCHGADLKTVRPADHDATWKVRHGAVSKWRGYGDHGTSCNGCHSPATCTSCHAENAPRDHNGLWRVRAHGLSAEWDRDRCKTCHETGTCIRCHSTTPPMNHNGAWKQTHGLVAGSRVNDTCNVCHRAAECAACHSGR